MTPVADQSDLDTISARFAALEARVSVLEGVEPPPPPPPPPPVIVGETIDGELLFEGLHIHADKTLTILPTAKLIRRDVPIADPDHTNGGIMVEGLLRIPWTGGPKAVITSENPSGIRGHLMAMNSGVMQIDGVIIRDFGRTRLEPLSDTNKLAEYSCHWHLVGEAGINSWIRDSEIFDTVPGFRNGIVLHGVQGVQVQRCHVHHKAGSGIYCEDGSEACLIEDNVIEDILGSNMNPENDPAQYTERQWPDQGFEGNGIYLHGPLNSIRRNQAARCPIGFNLQFTHSGYGHLPIAAFENNEAIGCRDGYQIYNVGREGDEWHLPAARRSMAGNRAINCSKRGCYNYGSWSLDIVDFYARGCPFGYFGGDYVQLDTKILSPDVAECGVGLFPSSFTGPVLIQDGTVNSILLSSLWKTGGGQFCQPRDVRIAGTDYGVLSLQLTAMGNENYTLLDRVWVDGERVYRREQAADAIVPQSAGAIIGCPEAGLTNAQAWATYGVAMAGEIAPDGARFSE